MQLLTQIRQIWQQLSPRQRIGLASGAAGIVLAVVLTTHWAGRTRYEVLFSNLEQDDAGRIVENLREEGQSYRLENGGRTILVPAESALDLRLDLASAGFLGKSVVGYEIFDRNTLGMTDFVQKLNFQRAMEGELARTIEQFEEITYARVHVVIPEESLYEENEKETTASVLVKIRDGRSLAKRNVETIQRLVAASVPDLSAEHVTVAGANGEALSRQYADDAEEANSRRVELQKSVERHLSQKALAMLQGVLGPGKALVEVNAELDFERVDRTVETYDGDNPVIRSEERSTQSGDDESGESLVTNYEISRTLERVIGSASNLKRISVAVLVDGVQVEPDDPGGAVTVRPRTSTELAQLRSVIEDAVGIDASRGDRVTVQSINFDRRFLEEQQTAIQQQERMQMILDLANKLGVGAVVVILLLLARNFIGESKKMFAAEESAEEMAKLGGVEPEELRLLEMKQQLNALVDENPDRVVHLVRAWMRKETA